MKSTTALILTVALLAGIAGAVTHPSEVRPLVMLSADGGTVFKQTDPLTRAFLAGAVKGIAYYNLMLRMEGKPALFCQPGGGLGLDEFWGFAAQVLKGPHSQDTIVTTALHRLADRYPCEPSDERD